MMIVQCITEFPTDQQARLLESHKLYLSGKQVFGVVVGRQYLVFAIRVLKGTIWLDILSESGYLYPVPLYLFNIIDGRMSRYWELRRYDDGDIVIQPTSFF